MWRLKFLILQETGMRAEQKREKEKIAAIFFRKIIGHEEGNSKGEDLQLEDIPTVTQ